MSGGLLPRSAASRTSRGPIWSSLQLGASIRQRLLSVARQRKDLGRRFDLCEKRGPCRCELLGKHLLDRSHRAKERSLHLREIKKPVFRIERNCRVVFGVHNNSGGRRLFAQVKAAVKSVHQQCFPNALPAKFVAHREPTEKGCPNHGIFGQLLGNRVRYGIELDRVLRERALACDGLSVCRRNKGNCRAFSGVLPRLFLKA